MPAAVTCAAGKHAVAAVTFALPGAPAELFGHKGHSAGVARYVGGDRCRHKVPAATTAAATAAAAGVRLMYFTVAYGPQTSYRPQ